MAPNACSSWVIVDLTPDTGEAVESGEFILGQPIQMPQLQLVTSFEQLSFPSPGTLDYLYPVFPNYGPETTIVDSSCYQNDSEYIVTPKQRVKQTLNKYKNVNSTKSHHVVAQLWFPVVIEGDLVLRKSGHYAFGPLVNTDPIKKKLYKRFILESSRKAFPIGWKSAESLGVVGDEDIPLLLNLDVGIILINRWVACKAFLLERVQWAPNIHIYGSNSENYIFGTLALPVFDSATNQCVGVFELVIDCPYIDYVAEILEICQLLQEASLVTYTELADQPRQMVHLEIMNLLRNVSQFHNLPLAQTWLPCKCCGGVHNSQTMQICMCSPEIPFTLMDCSLFEFWKTSSMHHICEGQGVAGRAFQSKGTCFCSDITQFSDENVPLVHTSRKFRVYSSLAICLKSSNTGEDIYIVQFFTPNRLTTVKEQKHFIDSIVKSVGGTCGSLKLASFELEVIADAKLGKITKHKWLSNICMVDEQNNLVSSSKTCRVGHLSEDMVHKGKAGPMVELNAKNDDVGFKRVRKKKTEEVVSCIEDLRALLMHTKEDAAKKLGVSRSTIKRMPQQFGFKNWSDAQKSNGVSPTKRRRKADKSEALDCDEPSSSSGI